MENTAIETETTIPKTQTTTSKKETTGFIEGDYIYSLLSDKTVEIIRYTGSDEVVNIPSSINGYDVSKIGFSAFAGSSSIVSVSIHESVTEIVRHAFYQCPNLTDIIIPGSVIKLGSSAFEDTSFLNNQKDNFFIINKHLIKYNGNETNVKISENVEVISNAFDKNNNIISVEIPDTVIGIGERAFNECGDLENVYLPDTGIIIGAEAFISCKNLININLSEKINEIGYNAFASTKYWYKMIDDNIYFVVNDILLSCHFSFAKGDLKIPDDLNIKNSKRSIY